MKHTFEQKVFFADTDAYSVVWHGTYLRWMEAGRIMWCDETGHCHCLNNTTFRRRNGKTYKCPFYKTKAEVGEDLINTDVESEI